MPNRLAGEKSPYLLQHAENPVQWFPWGEAAFAEARRTERPIFLSIGYSTCHWCHVMEHESFENDEVAALLNRDFVPIKVDREERPDIDRVYMTFVQATTGTGGWPLSVWLTPDLEPIYGGTYFPPASRWGRPGFIEVLREIARVWKVDRERVRLAAAEMTSRLRGARRPSPAHEAAAPDILARGVEDLRRAFDARHGGFGDAPKFPRPSELLFLFREFARTGRGDARDMALATLRGIAAGGLHDHLGGGFHRYAVDAAWRIPHFEKMLYDQAQLVLALLDAVQITGDPQFIAVVEETLEYVRRDMTSPFGGFYSAEDADSLPPGDPHATRKREGAFYVWEAAEVDRLLGEDAGPFRLRFGVEPAGNAPDDPHGELQGQNHLYEARTVAEVARLSGRTAAEVEAALARAKAALFVTRARRPRPHLDDKVLACWNGLMIAAFARAARVLGRPDWLLAAAGAAAFIRTTLWNADTNRLLRRYRDGEAAIDAFADDYACLVFGLLELFQADGNPEWLAWALSLQQAQDSLFWDASDGGWFSSSGSDPNVLLRSKDDYDGAEPSPTAVSVWNLQVLAHLTGDMSKLDKVEQAFSHFSSLTSGASRAVPMLMSALSIRSAAVRQVVIVGPPDRADTRTLKAALGRRFLPFVICIPVDPERRRSLEPLLPSVGAMSLADGRATAYVCSNFACQAPTPDADTMLAQLG